MSFPPFYFYIPHQSSDDWLWSYWGWDLGQSGLLILCITLVLTGLTILFIRKGFTWSWVYLHFAIAGVIPMVGINGMIWENCQVMIFVTRGLKAPSQITGHLWHTCQLTFLAEGCFLYTAALGVLLILTKLNWISFDSFKKFSAKAQTTT